MVTNGGDEPVRVSERERDPESEGEAEGVQGGPERRRGGASRRLGEAGEQGGGVAHRARMRCPASAYWQRLGMTGRGQLGWAGLLGRR